MIFEVETISMLTPNYLVVRTAFDPTTTYNLSDHSIVIKPPKPQNIIGHFWDKLRH